MNILVAGGSGFVGSNFCQLLLNKGHKVWAVDNLITGRKENLDKIIDNNNFTFIQSDVIDPQIKDRLEEVEFQVIYHFASPASPPWYQKYPLETLEVNSVGTKNLLEIAKRDNAKFIFCFNF